MTGRQEDVQAYYNTVAAGYVITCAGDPESYNDKGPRVGDSVADRAAINVLSQCNGVKKIFVEFSPTKAVVHTNIVRPDSSCLLCL